MRRINNTKLCPILNSKILSQSIEDLPVIIQFKEEAKTLIEDVREMSSKVKCNLPIIHGFAGNLTTDLLFRLSSNPDIEYISFDSNVYTLLDIAMPSMKVDFPHREGFFGDGITIAVIDTGVAPHNDLVKNGNRIIGFKDLVNGKNSPYDDSGHGTHVAGIVAAAGNNGPDTESILSPGISREVITVGAVDDKRTIDPTDDTIATFSSRGPTLDGELKPDLVAPGVNIQSLSNAKLDSYTSLSGTSMATPLVTGSVALLMEKHGDLSQKEVKKKLVNSCYDLKDKETNQGAGVLSLEKLFEDNLKKKISPSKDKEENQLLEGLIILVLILFLLDARI